MWMIYTAMAALFLIWTIAAAVMRNRSYSVKNKWILFNLIVLVAALLVIAYGTLLTRNEGSRRIIWQIGSMFRTYGVSNEAWRLLVMNCLLFFPFGLALPNLLPQSIPPLWRSILALIVAFLLSSALEQMQYHYALGVTELDDILCNTLGGFVASLHTFAYGHRRRQR